EIFKFCTLRDQLATADPHLGLGIVETLPANTLKEIGLLIARHGQLPFVRESVGMVECDLNLSGQLLARMWQLDEQVSLSFLREAFPDDATVPTEQVRDLFWYLELWQLQKAALKC